MARQQIPNQNRRSLIDWMNWSKCCTSSGKKQLLAMLLMVLYGQAPVYCTVPYRTRGSAARASAMVKQIMDKAFTARFDSITWYGGLLVQRGLTVQHTAVVQGGRPHTCDRGHAGLSNCSPATMAHSIPALHYLTRACASAMLCKLCYLRPFMITKFLHVVY